MGTDDAAKPGGGTDRPGNYRTQADTYDLTRGASPSVIRAVGARLGPGEGRTLLDIAGGTGNYALAFQQRGHDVRVVDAEPAMLAHAARKLGPSRVVAGDATALPIRGAAVDRAMIISAIHLFADPGAALAEARRVIRAGPLVVMAFTLENLQPLFVAEYFGDVRPSDVRRSRIEMVEDLRLAGFARAEAEIGIYTDTVDGSLSALHTNALYLAGPAYLRNTSFWHRLDEDTRREGLAALARDLRSGVLQERVHDSYRKAIAEGHFTVFTAHP